MEKIYKDTSEERYPGNWNKRINNDIRILSRPIIHEFLDEDGIIQKHGQDKLELVHKFINNDYPGYGGYDFDTETESIYNYKWQNETKITCVPIIERFLDFVRIEMKYGIKIADTIRLFINFRNDETSDARGSICFGCFTDNPERDSDKTCWDKTYRIERIYDECGENEHEYIFSNKIIQNTKLIIANISSAEKEETVSFCKKCYTEENCRYKWLRIFKKLIIMNKFFKLHSKVMYNPGNTKYLETKEHFKSLINSI